MKGKPRVLKEHKAHVLTPKQQNHNLCLSWLHTIITDRLSSLYLSTPKPHPFLGSTHPHSQDVQLALVPPQSKARGPWTCSDPPASPSPWTAPPGGAKSHTHAHTHTCMYSHHIHFFLRGTLYFWSRMLYDYYRYSISLATTKRNIRVCTCTFKS